MMKMEYHIGSYMIDWLVKKLFLWTPLRTAIFDEVYMYKMLEEYDKDPEKRSIGSALYCDEDGWRGWSKSLSINRYYFNDVPEKNFMSAFNELELMEIRGMQLEFELDELW